MEKAEFIPALRYNWLTKLYDFVVGSTMPEKKFKTSLIRQANLLSGATVLDFGSGTSTLSILTKQINPKVRVMGVDVDEKIIEIGRKKIKNHGLDITIYKYDGTTLPFPDQSLDRVISSLVFHHLTTEQKKNAFREIYRVLKPSGELHIADWGKAQNSAMRLAFYLIQILDGFKTTSDNINNLLPRYIKEAGFREVRQGKYYNTVFGTIRLFEAIK